MPDVPRGPMSTPPSLFSQASTMEDSAHAPSQQDGLQAHSQGLNAAAHNGCNGCRCTHRHQQQQLQRCQPSELRPRAAHVPASAAGIGAAGTTLNIRLAKRLALHQLALSQLATPHTQGMRLAQQLAPGQLAEPWGSPLQPHSAANSLMASLLQASAFLLHPAELLNS